MIVPPFPTKVMVQTTSRCNAACAFCPHSLLRRRLPQGDMEESLFGRLLDECTLHQAEIQRLLLYLMNEPLLDPLLVRRIDQAKARLPQSELHILTNGSLLTQSLGDQLIDSGLDWVGISVHGFSDQAYQTVTGLSQHQTYRRVERFITKALARRGPDFIMITFHGGGAVTPEEREAELDYFRTLGVQRLSFFSHPISRAGNVPTIRAPRVTRMKGCHSIWWAEMIHILYNGDVVLCCMDWRRQIIMGNLHRSSLAEIWQGEPYRRARQIISGRSKLPYDFLCHRCEEAQIRELPPPADVTLVQPLDKSAVHAASLVELLAQALIQRGHRVERLELKQPGSCIPPTEMPHGRSIQDPALQVPACPPLSQAELDTVEQWTPQCSARLGQQQLVFFLPPRAELTLEVIRRLRERDYERTPLVLGRAADPPELLQQLTVPYHQLRCIQETGVWIHQFIVKG